MKQNELIEGVDYYLNEDGFIVFTEKYHLEKGFCCGIGCLHCPYNYENVPEPKRSEFPASKTKKKINNFISCLLLKKHQIS